jgi:hypothetical protein
MARVLASLLSILILGFSAPAWAAATYYIDYNQPDDSKAGISISTAWKRHPYMNGFTGNYQHAPGDRFIFKGGVTWTTAAFSMKLLAGGDSDIRRDYYGVDKSWHSGAAWTRPVFDMQNKFVTRRPASSTADGQIIIDVNGVSFVTIEGIEFKNQLIPNDPDLSDRYDPAYLACAVTIQNGDYVTVRDVYIHDWDMSARTIDGNSGGVCASATGGHTVVEYSDIGPAGPCGANRVMRACGLSVRNIYFVRYNRLHGNPNTVLGGGAEINHNEIFDVTDSFDTNAHENGIETFQGGKIHDNIIHHVAAGVTVAVGPGFATSGGTISFYNNVVYQVGPTPFQMDCTQAHTVPTGARVYSNTLEHAAYGVLRFSGSNCDFVEAINNLYITDISWTGPVDYGTYPNPVDQNNKKLTQAEALSFGYSKSNNFKTINASSPAIDNGKPLPTYFTTDILGVARPYGKEWDIGAYEYAGPTPNSPGNLRVQ